MKTDELRDKYLDFFKTKGHTVCASDVMVPKWDKTVLFTPAGMNQFKDHFLGKVELEFTKATTAQKCLRTGDIENVGRTAYHHTFFEMLGNFSFGDYFKREAIHWAWEFLTDPKWLNIDKDRLSVTVYLDDDEAHNIWQQEIGLPEKRIQRLDEKENFWPAGAPTSGPDGVCGPCSEIFFQPDDGPECEIWNLVFTQFNRSGDPPNNLHPLPMQNIDTGMGLERTAAVLQGCSTNYHIDTLMPIVQAAAEVCGVKYDANSDNGRRLRRITDHIRAVSLAIHENVYPGSQKEEFVVRLLLRRAVLQGYEMGLRDPFLYQLVPEVVQQLKLPYPELTESVDRVSSVIKEQENAFYSLIDRSIPLIEGIAKEAVAAGKNKIDADQVAQAYQTHGVPGPISESVAEQHGLGFDWDEFDAAMERHAIISGNDEEGVMGNDGPVDDLKQLLKSTEFLGYSSQTSSASVKGLIQEVAVETQTDKGETKTTIELERREALTSPANSTSPQQQLLFLEKTPFYAESGGQIGDSGTISGPNGTFEVVDTQKDGDVFIHYGQMTQGEIKVDDEVTASVDTERRDGICRAHTATHILHHALQQHVGSHAQQRGSKVSPDDLRFDFANMDPIPDSTLIAMEKQTIEKIKSSATVDAQILPLEDAREQGAMMLFGEKYPDPVRMVSVGDFSKELCGGIHVGNSSDIAAFEIVVEENVGSGTRRIQALTGEKATAQIAQNRQQVATVCERLQVDLQGFQAAVLGLNEQVKGLKKQVSSGRKSKQEAATVGGTGDSSTVAAADYFELRTELRSTAEALNIAPSKVAERVEQMIAEIKKLETDLEKLSAAGDISADDLIAGATKVGDIQLIALELPGANNGLMRQLFDQIRKKTNPVAILFASKISDEKVMLATAISRDLVDQGYHAGNWIKEIAPVVGGRGGGKPDMAQAGGSDPSKIADAITAAAETLATLGK